MTESAGGKLDFPPARSAALLIHYLHQVGWSEAGGEGFIPLNPQTLLAWQAGTRTTLGPSDFQQMLDASRAYVAAYYEFRNVNAPPPWEENHMTRAEMNAAEEAEFDRIMGISND